MPKPVRRPRPRSVAVTGGIGAGKSLALSILRSEGVPVLSADEVAHRVLRLPEVVRKVKKTFGPGVGAPEGGIDRKKLALRVFRDPDSVRRLQRILHPRVRSRLRRWISRRRRLSVVEVPLLFESGFTDLFDGVLSISAPSRLRCRRAGVARFRQRAGHQWSQALKDRRADWVIRNGGSMSSFRHEVEDWLWRMRSGNP